MNPSGTVNVGRASAGLRGAVLRTISSNGSAAHTGFPERIDTTANAVAIALHLIKMPVFDSSAKLLTRSAPRTQRYARLLKHR
jgi:hypothetical protein